MIVSVILVTVDAQNVKYTTSYAFSEYGGDMSNASINAFSSLMGDFRYSEFFPSTDYEGSNEEL